MLVSLLLVLGLLIRFDNLTYSWDFTSSSMINFSYDYGLEYERSSAANYLNSIRGTNSVFYGLILLLGQIAFLINRSELWGLFLSRYNPTSLELLFGTGPFSLSDHYGDISIKTERITSETPLGFLLPHSSLLLILLFFGFVGFFCLSVILYKKIKSIKSVNYDIYILCIFVLLNLLKSDSILYLPSFVLYFVILFVLTDKKEIENDKSLNS